MATGVELATGYVTVAVETSEVAKGVGRAFAGVERTAGTAGRDMGQAMSREWAKTKPDMGTLAKDVERAESRATTAVQRNGTLQEAAKRKVEIAQAKVNETTAKYGSKSSQALTATDRLATAQDKYKAVTLKAKQEQDKLNSELEQAKGAYAQAERAAADAAGKSAGHANRYAAGWKGVGQRIKTTLTGGVRGAVSAADGAAGGSTGATKYADGWRGVGQRLKGTLSSGVRAAAARAEQDAEAGGKRAGGGFADAFKGALAGLAAYTGVQQVGQLLWSSVQESGNLEQSVGAIDSVFKSSADTMHAWAASSSTAVGLSANEYNELGTLIGSQLKNGGTAIDELAPKTNDLIGLGADLASMFGGTTKDAVGALSSALKGERDPIEAYGVSLNQAQVDAKAAELGFQKVGGSLSGEANQAATLALIMEQTADAHGNFARESDTFAHKQQVMQAKWLDLKAAMGEAFMPVLANVFGFIADTAIPAFGHLGEVMAPVFQWVRETAPIWGPFAIGIGAVAAAVGLFAAAGAVVTAITTAWGIATGATAGAMGFLATAMAVVMSPITWVVVGVGLLVGALILAYNNVGWFRTAVDTAFAAIGVAIGAVVTWFTTVAWPAFQVVLTALGTAFTWLWQNIVVPAFAGIGAAIGAVITWITTIAVPWVQTALAALGAVFSWLYVNIVTPIWTGIKIVIAGVVAVLMTIWQGMVWTLQTVVAPVFSWLYNSIIIPVWNGIKAFINATWVFIRDWVFFPIRNFITGPLAGAFTWFRDSVIAPVWAGIRGAINAAWVFIRDWVFSPIRNFITGPLAGAFRWFRDSVIAPVWGGIRSIISTAWGFIRDWVFSPIRSFLTGPLAGAFRWFRDNLIAPVWNGVRNIIRDGWVFIRDVVFAPLKSAIMDSVPAAFRKGKDAIGKIWGGLQDVAKKPVKFVIETVINNGLISNFNKIADKIGIGKLPAVALPPGFAVGGWTGRGSTYQPAGVVHADEFVVKKSSRRKFEAENPGVLDHINATGEMPTRMDQRPARKGEAYAGGPPGGPSAGLWGRIENDMMRTGRLYVPNTNIQGANLAQAARAWMGRSALDIRIGHGSPQVNGHVGHRGPWGFADTDGNLEISTTTPANRVIGTMIHELGHILSLQHSGNGGYGDTSSIMSAGMSGGDFPHPADFAKVAEIWGQPGKGVRQYSASEVGASGGGGIMSWLYDKFIAPIVGWVTGIMDKTKSAAPGAGMWVDMAAGVGKKLASEIKDFVTDKINIFDGGGDDGGGGSEQWRGTITEALKRTGLPTSSEYVDAWLRQVQSESGGNPRAVQNGYTDANTGGNEAAGLLQVAGNTWRAYRDPSLPDDRFNPLASAVAGMRWAKARYGIAGMLGVIGHGHGYAEGGRVAPWKPTLYDKGGLIHEGVTLVDHQRSQPDKVLTDGQWRTMSTIAENAQARGGAPLVGTLQALDLDDAMRRLAYEQKKDEVLHR